MENIPKLCHSFAGKSQFDYLHYSPLTEFNFSGRVLAERGKTLFPCFDRQAIDQDSWENPIHSFNEKYYCSIILLIPSIMSGWYWYITNESMQA